MEAAVIRLAEPDLQAPLGERLVRHGLITPRQLAAALAVQSRSGARLGDILIGQGVIRYDALYRAVADAYGLPFVDVLKAPPDPALPRAADVPDYLRLRLLPWRREDGRTVIVLCELSFEAMVWIRQRFGTRTRLAVTSPFDIRRTVERLFGASLEKDSRLSLWKKLPQLSARITMARGQKRFFLFLLLASLTLLAVTPAFAALALLAACHIAYAVTLLFKAIVFACGRGAPVLSLGEVPPDPLASRRAQFNKVGGGDRPLAHQAPPDAHDLPVYTVLLPMFDEAASLPGLLEAMRQLDYPAARLDIKLVLEADDAATIKAAYALRPGYQFDIIRVPPGKLRTKPRACNYALRFARGEFVTLFDADDRPEPGQLKKAVHAFRTLPPDVACLQARLNYYNAGDNLLTRLFSLEYTILFRVMLYGLERLRIPIPLGGTSNHIALERLRALGEWDPYNVTEDADLGARLAARGLRTAMLDSYTLEEAPNRYGAWIKQRSRWIKGYMQTWLVHMRRPGELLRALGWKSFLGFQCFFGLSSFTFLTVPLAWGVSLLWLARPEYFEGVPFPAWLAWLTAVNLLFYLASHWHYTLACARDHHDPNRSLRAAALLYPLYLILHSIASYKALWQLFARPHFWEKTRHGLCFQNAPDKRHGDTPAFR